MTARDEKERGLLGDAVCIARDHFGISGTAGRLYGCEGHIFRIREAAGTQWVLKLSPASLADSIELQCHVLNFLARRNPGVATPSHKPALENGLPRVEFDGEPWLAWMVRYLPGRVQASIDPKYRSPHELGAVMGRLDRVLSRFDDDKARRYLRWDLAQGKDLRAGAGPVKDPVRRELAGYMLERSLAAVDRLDTELRKSIIHGDANDHNLLIDHDETTITAIIDFGDLVETWRIVEAANAAAYALFD
ncbi:MAG: phosphotransferase, partial [Gammaproteobacteria bacterium]|nr:phosphotransferase [Gammaproteobacteria bacterium]